MIVRASLVILALVSMIVDVAAVEVVVETVYGPVQGGSSMFGLDWKGWMHKDTDLPFFEQNEFGMHNGICQDRKWTSFNSIIETFFKSFTHLANSFLL